MMKDLAITKNVKMFPLYCIYYMVYKRMSQVYAQTYWNVHGYKFLSGGYSYTRPSYHLELKIVQRWLLP